MQRAVSFSLGALLIPAVVAAELQRTSRRLLIDAGCVPHYQSRWVGGRAGVKNSSAANATAMLIFLCCILILMCQHFSREDIKLSKLKVGLAAVKNRGQLRKHFLIR